MADRVRVAVLEDHPGMLARYGERLSAAPHTEMVGAGREWAEFQRLLASRPVDVAVLDVNVPTSPDNPSPYPLLQALPQLLQKYPALSVLVVSMRAERALVEAVLAAGASGYLLKDDPETLPNLASLVTSAANGNVCLSPALHRLLTRRLSRAGEPRLTAPQREALCLSADYPDATLAELAQRLGVMNATLRNLISGACLRLGVVTRAAAVARARQLGLIPPAAAAGR